MVRSSHDVFFFENKKKKINLQQTLKKKMIEQDASLYIK